jgi:Ca2+-binding RTX toxin-like protein
MVFKALSGGTGGDLNNAGDNYGYFADTVLVLDNIDYVIRTYEGNDRIDFSRVTLAIAEATTYSGSGNDTIIGGISIQRVFDGSGNDNVSLGANDDYAFVGSGNDALDGGSGTDFLYFFYQSNDGLDILTPNTVGVSVDLAKTTAQNFGVFGFDTVKNFENVAGGNGNDTVSGTNGANVLSGASGNDTLNGRGGNDILYGNFDADILIGGAGADDIDTGGDSARDKVQYFAVTDSGTTAATRDEILQFTNGGTSTDDKIDFSAMDGNSALAGNQAFTFRTGAFSTNVKSEIRVTVSGADSIVHVDTDSDTVAEMTILVVGVTGLTAADFIL